MKKKNLAHTFKKVQKRKRPQVLYFKNGTWLTPLDEGYDPYSRSRISADENNHMDVLFNAGVSFARIDEESLVYNDKLNMLLETLVDFAVENDFNVIQMDGLIPPKTVSALNDFGFATEYALTEGKCSCNTLLLPRRE